MNSGIKAYDENENIKPTGKTDKIFHMTSTNCEGLKMQIIEYHNSHDITVKFEDGTVRRHVKYMNFKSGNVKRPEIPAECKDCETGLSMKITTYKSDANIDVKFQDGTVGK